MNQIVSIGCLASVLSNAGVVTVDFRVLLPTRSSTNSLQLEGRISGSLSMALRMAQSVRSEMRGFSSRGVGKSFCTFFIQVSRGFTDL